MIVTGAPTTGDTLSAQKAIKPQKEVHGKGFKEIFNRKMEELNEERTEVLHIRSSQRIYTD